MIRIVLISLHQQESEVLQLAFKQNGYAVYVSKPDSVNYLQLLQFHPDFVLLEIPPVYHDQLALLRLLRKNERFGKTPVIAFGSVTDANMLNDIKVAGCTDFLVRPLRMNRIYELLRKAIPSQDPEAESKRIAQTLEQEKNTDQLRILDSAEPPSVKLELMIKHVGKLLSFPFVIAKILEITDDPNRGAEDLAKVISSDPSLCATILKVSNSVMFATSSKEIKNPKEAIMRLGFNEVKNIAMGLGLMVLFPEKDTFGFQRMDFWTYALGRAIITDKLSKHVGYSDSALAFLAGLLADFSVLLMDSFFPDLFAAVIQKIANEGVSLETATMDLLGFPAEEFVARLLEGWRLPKDLVEAIRVQPRFFERAEEKNPTPQRLLSDCVAFSKPLACAGEIGQGCDDVMGMPPDSMLREMRLPAGVAASFFDSVYSSLSIYAGFFGIDRKILPKIIEDSSSFKPALYLKAGRRSFDPYHLLLTRQFKLTTVRTPEELSQAIRTSSFHFAVVIPLQSEAMNEAKVLLQGLSGVKSNSGQLIPILGICPPHAPEPDLTGFNFVRTHQGGDLRQFSLTLETLVTAK